MLELGMAYIRAVDIWDIARPHMERLVAQTHESTSMAQLDGSDIVYVARVAVPKLIALASRSAPGSPQPPTSLGKVLLAGSPTTRSTPSWPSPAARDRTALAADT